MVRFDGSLYFANTSYFEDKIMERVALKPDLKFVIVVGDGINQVDATGEEMLAHLAERLHATGIEVLFTGLKKQVVDVFARAPGSTTSPAPARSSAPRNRRWTTPGKSSATSMRSTARSTSSAP